LAALPVGFLIATVRVGGVLLTPAPGDSTPPGLTTGKGKHGPGTDQQSDLTQYGVRESVSQCGEQRPVS